MEIVAAEDVAPHSVEAVAVTPRCVEAEAVVLEDAVFESVVLGCAGSLVVLIESHSVVADSADPQQAVLAAGSSS